MKKQSLFRFSLLILLSVVGESAFSQNQKVGVLVVGGNAGGVAAAIQAARSGVKTILMSEGATLGSDVTSSSAAFKGGIYGEFMKRVHEVKKDTNALTDPTTTAAVLQKMTDTVKNLTVLYNAGWEKIEKSGKSWELKLAGKKGSIKASSVIDATLKEILASSAGSFLDPKTRLRKMAVPPVPVTDLYQNQLYRTSIAVGLDAKTGQPYVIPMGAVIAAGIDNFFVIGKLTAAQLSSDAMYTGQGAGATASFFAFFETATSTLSINMPARAIQGELQRYGGWLFPFTDIKRSDRDFYAFEHITLSGILKTVKKGNEQVFQPDSTVSGQEIRTALKAYYSRSQIWFSDKGDLPKLTVGDMLSLLKYIGQRGNELDKEVEKAWKSSYRFDSKYELTHTITRREFSVLMENLLKPRPFDVRINLTGNPGN